MPIWFWGWLAATGLFAAMAFIVRDRYTPPWAAGAAVATALAATRLAPGWHWAAFFTVSAVLFVLLNRRRRGYTPKHKRGRTVAERDRAR